jgi:flagellar FliL protein
MAEEEIFEGDEGGEGGGEQAQGGKKVGFIPGFVLQILKYVAMGLGAVLFIVTITVITISIMGGGGRSQTVVSASPQYQGKEPTLEWYKDIGEIRGRTADEAPHTFIIDVQLGFTPGNKAIPVELSSRKPQVRDAIRSYFSKKKVEALRPEKEDSVKLDLMKDINALLSDGQLVRVIFENFMIVEF